MSGLPKPAILLILDGFGHRQDEQYNAIAQANTPCWDRLQRSYSSSFLSCSGETVGLPGTQMGNSEVGHLHIGSGQFIAQNFLKINREIDSGQFFDNVALKNSVKYALNNDKALHIMGLLSPGGVHSHEQHIFALLELAQGLGLKKVYVHVILDGRDVPPRSATDSIEKLISKIEQLGVGQIASVVGRFYAMDRDSRWERVENAYRLIANGEAEFQVDSAVQALKEGYARDENDEFMQSTAILDSAGKAVTMNDADAIVFMNFRSDRAREIIRSFTNDFSEFERRNPVKDLNITTLVEYHQDFDFPIAYESPVIINCLGEVLANRGLKQLRLAETEKYAHVTFFFNGGIDEPYTGEDRMLVPSPKVTTYDLQPEMSLPEVTDKLIKAIKGQEYDAIICNFANCDMVGHTGIMTATTQAVEAIDAALARVVEALNEAGGEMLITADHGNAEKMFDEQTQQPHTAHTNGLVPLIYVGKNKALADGGNLADLAPTLLDIMGIEQPAEMTGRSLLL